MRASRKRHPASLPADKRRNIRFSRTEVSLRQDVHQLGGLIGAMIQDRGGAELFEAVESARSLAIARRNGDASAHDRLQELLAGMDDSGAQDVSRAFATWFQATNTAEQLHRVRRRAPTSTTPANRNGAAPRRYFSSFARTGRTWRAPSIF